MFHFDEFHVKWYNVSLVLDFFLCLFCFFFLLVKTVVWSLDTFLQLK